MFNIIVLATVETPSFGGRRFFGAVSSCKSHAHGYHPAPMEYPKRKTPAHHPPVERHNEPVVLFVTACVREGADCLATSAGHEALRKCWAQADAWRVGAYMIMPDHVHLFCVPGVFPPVPVKKWAQYWKAMFRREMQLKESVWLRDVWDTQVRSYSHYVEKREYARRNPVRKGLVGHMNNGRSRVS